MNTIKSNLDSTFWNRLDLIVLKDSFCRAFTASGFMSSARIFFGGRIFDAVFERMPEPVPTSKNFNSGDLFLDRYSFRKFAKRIESSAG